jgi:ABC-type polar amino acid transport system ATPase subunit
MDASIVVKNLTKRYGSVVVLNNISHTFVNGNVTVICGPSGCGKSTLLRCVHALEQFQSGDIVVNGESLTKPTRSLPEVRAGIGMVFQQPNLYPHKTCIQNITLAPIKVSKVPRDQAEAEAMDLLLRVGLKDRANRFPSELSGGEQQRVAIARALAMKPKILLFDEPTSALDPERVSEVLDVMASLVEERITMLVVTHELRFAARVAQEIVFMDKGSIVEVGDSSWIANPRSERGQRFVSKIIH